DSGISYSFYTARNYTGQETIWMVLVANPDDVRWGTARRFEFIEWRVYWTGSVNRGDLTERFQISGPQAAADLKLYRETAPDNIYYDETRKAYVPSDDFRPRFLRLSADRYLLQVNSIQTGAVEPIDTWFMSIPPVAVAPRINRSVDSTSLRTLLRAI